MSGSSGSVFLSKRARILERKNDLYETPAVATEAPLRAENLPDVRLPMMHRAGWGGPKTSSSIAFAWFVWDRNHSGPTILSRISWETA